MKNKLFIIITAIILAGCQTVGPTSVLDKTTTVQKKEIVIDSEIMKDCANLKYLSYPVTFEELLVVYADNVQAYVNCKKQNAAKKKILQEYVLRENKR